MSARTADVLFFITSTIGHVILYLGAFAIIAYLATIGEDLWAFAIFIVTCFIEISYKRVDDEAPEHVVRALDDEAS